MPYASISIVLPLRFANLSLYTAESIIDDLPPIEMSPSFTLLPTNRSDLAFSNVMKDRVLPPSHRALADCFVLPLAVSHNVCVGRITSPEGFPSASLA